MAAPKLAPLQDLPVFFSFDSYVRDIAYEHADAPLLILRVHRGPPTNENTLIVQTCGNCAVCEPESYQLIKIGSIYTVKQKKQLNTLLRRGSLHLVGAMTVPLIEPIGRVIGWLQG